MPKIRWNVSSGSNQKTTMKSPARVEISRDGIPKKRVINRTPNGHRPMPIPNIIMLSPAPRLINTPSAVRMMPKISTRGRRLW